MGPSKNLSDDWTDLYESKYTNLLWSRFCIQLYCIAGIHDDVLFAIVTHLENLRINENCFVWGLAKYDFPNFEKL